MAMPMVLARSPPTGKNASAASASRRPVSAGRPRAVTAATETSAVAADLSSSEVWMLEIECVELQELVWQLRLENESLHVQRDDVQQEHIKLQAAHDAAKQELCVMRAQMAEDQMRITGIETSNRELLTEHERLLEQRNTSQLEVNETKREREFLAGQLLLAHNQLKELEIAQDAMQSKRDLVASKLGETEGQLRCEQRENQILMRVAVEQGITRRMKELRFTEEAKAARSRRRGGKNGLADPLRNRMVRRS